MQMARLAGESVDRQPAQCRIVDDVHLRSRISLERPASPMSKRVRPECLEVPSDELDRLARSLEFLRLLLRLASSSWRFLLAYSSLQPATRLLLDLAS